MLPKISRIVAIASLALLGATSAQAARHHAHYVEPPCHHELLPTFGMHTYNDGYGEQVVRVRHGGLACRLGLERGDTIVQLNQYPLNYHGSWQHALRRAMRHGGHVVLRIRDMHTGRLVVRHIDLPLGGPVIEPPIGPITPKAAPVAGYRHRPNRVVGEPRHVERHTATGPRHFDRRGDGTPRMFRGMMQRHLAMLGQ